MGSPCTERANLYDIIQGNYSIHWPSVSLESWPGFRIECSAVRVTSTSLRRPTWRRIFCVMLYMGQNPHALAELPVVHPTSILFLQAWAMYWNFLVATCNCTWQEYVQYLLMASTTCLCTLNCTFAQVIVHISVFIMVTVFHKMAICVTWAALNGAKGGQYGRVLLCLPFSPFPCIQ